jgi:hypothetical protein
MRMGAKIFMFLGRQPVAKSGRIEWCLGLDVWSYSRWMCYEWEIYGTTSGFNILSIEFGILLKLSTPSSVPIPHSESKG